MKIPGSGGRLFRKYVVVLLVLVGGVLMASSLVELYFSYRETQLAIVRVERAKAVAAAAGIEQFLKEVEQQVRETTRTASDDPDASQVGQGKLGFRQGLGAALAEQRELDFLRVLRNVPAISELSHLDLAGKEQLRVSRLNPDVVGSQEDFSQAPKFLQARTGKTYWSPVYFKNESEPYVTLAVPLGKYALEVTTAEISLGAVLKAVSQIEVGPAGYAYVVDSRNQLVAHPDSRTLRERRDVSALVQVKSARADRSGPTADAPVAVVAGGLGGGRVLAAHAAIAPLGWLVFVERPAADAYAPLRAPIIRSAVIFVLGVGLSVLASLFLARRMVAPIQVLQEGAARIGAGRLDQPIELHTGDEIEALAVSFNRMTASLKESYEGLEQKVEARTRELADANRDLSETLEQQTATSEILRVISSSPTDIQPVLDAVAESAARLCESPDAQIFRRDGDRLLLVAHHGAIPLGSSGELTLPLVPGTVNGRCVLGGRTVHVADLQTEAEGFPEGSELARQEGSRVHLSIPLMREGVALGTISLRRTEAGLFTARQVALLQTFADQAVIAIENVRLFKELETRNRDLTEALEQQTATSEVLKVISRSTFDLEPVLETLIENATRLCGADKGQIFRPDGDVFRSAVAYGSSPEFMEILERHPIRPGRESATGRAVLEGRVIHIQDVSADPEYRWAEGQRGGEVRTILAVPMLREGTVIGVIVIRRSEVRPFTDKQIELVTTFADQAVIAIENVRLFTELEARNRDLTESLEQQTATAEILRVISSSPTELQPVFDAIAHNAVRLCDATYSVIGRYDGQLLHLVAHDHVRPEGVQAMLQLFPMPPSRRTTSSRAILDRAVVHVPDVLEDPDYALPVALGIQNRSTLAVPMLRDGNPIGTISVGRLEPQPFTEKQIALLQTFADQAVIAVATVHLFKELETRNRDLTEALEQQTATSEILRVISSSPTDIEPVLDALVKSATRFCGAYDALILLPAGDNLRVTAHHGPILDPVGLLVPLVRGTAAGRSLLERRAIHVADLQAEAEDFPESYVLAREWGHRTTLSVPLMRESAAIGVIQLRRTEVAPFSDKQITLLETFADQAVIAIENVRLFKELEVRNRDLTEALEQQTATSEILRVISQSPTDIEPVLDALVKSATRFCGAYDAVIFLPEGDSLRVTAHHGPIPQPAGLLVPVVRGTVGGRALLERRAIHVADLQAEVQEFPEGSEFARRLGHRTTLSVPLVRESAAIGVIQLRRAEVNPFSDKQITLLETFADQAVIAIENVRLFKELEVRNRDLTETLEQQTATSEILRVISQSPTDVQPVFDTIVRSAVRLCGGLFGTAIRFDGELLHLAAHHNYTPEVLRALQEMLPMRPDRRLMSARAILTHEVVHVEDALADPEYAQPVARAGGFRSMLAVPMLREGSPIGAIVVNREQLGPFSAGQIELLKTFADQAVIAIENVRLFKELQERTQELTHSVEELRALGEVGQAVSGSLDIQSVLTSIVSHAVELSKTDAGTIYEFDEATQAFVPRANYGMAEELIEALRQSHIRVGEGAVGQMARTHAAFQIGDLEREPHYALRFLIEAGYRALLAVPLLREDRVIGGLVVRRKVAGTFPKPIVDLLQTFATQSVIAIQNARLFLEIDEKSRALEELSRNQEQLARLSTALQEPLSLSEQLTRVLDAARQVVGLDHLYIWTPTPAGDGFMVSAGAGLSESDWRDLVGVTIPIGEAGALAAVYRDGEPLLFSEAQPVPEKYRLRLPYSAIAALRLKAFLVSPMIARGRTVGVLSGDNRVSRAPIPAHTVDLLHSFAAQAAVAVENARLFQEIQEKSQQLELASKHKSQFLANMSHELRTPMNAVLGYTDLILDDIFGDVPARIRETLERVKTNGQHLLSLINDVLDLSKMEAGQLTLSLSDYAMGEVVHAVVSAVESLAAGKKLAFKAIVPADLPAGRGDERRLTQVLLNLAGNAIKFTDTGAVSIEARAADGAFVVSVSDTGPGISEADQQKIFEEFQQADSSSTRKKGGSGLGLSISRRIVELHGGRLWVESALGEGSTFYFTVPLTVERQGERA